MRGAQPTMLESRPDPKQRILGSRRSVAEIRHAVPFRKSYCLQAAPFHAADACGLCVSVVLHSIGSSRTPEPCSEIEGDCFRLERASVRASCNRRFRPVGRTSPTRFSVALFNCTQEHAPRGRDIRGDRPGCMDAASPPCGSKSRLNWASSTKGAGSFEVDLLDQPNTSRTTRIKMRAPVSMRVSGNS